jgi:hypothetical protein
MDFKHGFGTTPTVGSASLQLKLFNFLEGASIEVAHLNEKPLSLLRFSSRIFCSPEIPTIIFSIQFC